MKRAADLVRQHGHKGRLALLARCAAPATGDRPMLRAARDFKPCIVPPVTPSVASAAFESMTACSAAAVSAVSAASAASVASGAPVRSMASALSMA